MNTDEFYHARKKDWEELDRLLARSTKGASQLSPAEIRLLGRLYRSATADLALAQRDFPNHRVTVYLNQLAARAHAAVYQSEPLILRRLKDFVTGGFAQLYRRNLSFTLVATLMFVLPALLSGISAAMVPGSARWLLPASAQDLAASIEEEGLWTDIPIEERPYASSFIMQNNIQVAFLAFGGGIPGGLLTVWVMVMNGINLGTLTGLTSYYGLGFDLWTFVIGHGVIELSVIFIAGGAGLSLGWAVIHPGVLRRGDALVQAARQSIQLLVGCIPLLVVAGIIEGFISPAEGIPAVFKWLVGFGTGVALYAYLFLAGRPAAHRKSTTLSYPSAPGND